MLFDLLAGPNADDAVGWQLALPASRAHDLSEFRVAAWLDDEFCPVDPSVTAVLESAVSALEEAGARIDHDRRPTIDPLDAAVSGANVISLATDISESDEIDAPHVDQLQGAMHRQWDIMHRQRNEVRQRWQEFFGDVDVLLCPVTPTPAFKHVQSDQGSNWAHSVLADFGDMPYRHLLRWNTLIGSAYLPVTVPPIGRTESGLPVGIQVVAPYLHDLTALTFARRITEVLGGYEPPPLAMG